VIAIARPNFSKEGIQEWEELIAKYKDIFVVKSSDY
jgi:hypothetical protein